jgi:hypothetical protein
MDMDGDHELGRPRYQPVPGERGTSVGAPPPAPAGGGVRKTAPAAVVALVIAAVGWLVPVLGGVITVRRANAALRVIAAAGGELDGATLAIWARRLGWCSALAWSALLFVRYGGLLIQLTFSLLVR